ncbi:putative amino acid transporter, transmembrane domain-containing protein [Helianthus annuus]|nr:putative amino acid transporter, transmembrane domain-containing protein [Helianthus annuus]KAJ0641098.1 putative amino acid transporter, transmembrane domain-containing protein [Helianthus annuus]KAJ0645018.1 putative amino acid transporter, transmembrane domain-containing protein [Helianthus annuus]KAJ0836144.1 putative amino acid transporter, transmembrane domain-containing protein [Helianthus annuus]
MQKLPSLSFDDDGRIRRTGTLITTSAHIMTVVVGSGVLSLAWCLAQLGWIIGVLLLVAFAVITWYTCILLSDCYRSPDPVTGTRNYNYMQAVKVNLGGFKYKLCGISQYAIQVGASIGYTITSAISMAAVKRSNCFHVHGHKNGCHTLNNKYVLIFACIEIVLSQIPNFHKLSLVSIVATIMSFAYASIGIVLSVARIAGGTSSKTSLSGKPIGPDMTSMEKMWNAFSAIGDIAFAYSFCPDTLKPSPPENKVMKKSCTIGIGASTLLYMICGILGYLAFGNDSSGNYLTGFGFYEPFWLVDIGNISVVIHLLGAFQVIIQPFFAFVENWSREKWPGCKFIEEEYIIGKYNINMFRLTWRTCYVILVAIVAMMFPFFNSFMGLIGSATYWPLTIYFPIEMYISRAKIRTGFFTWIWLKLLTLICLIIALLAAAGSVRGLVVSFSSFEIFRSVS